MEIRKVLGRKDGVKMVIVPKNSDIQIGEYVEINKIKEDTNGRKRKSN